MGTQLSSVRPRRNLEEDTYWIKTKSVTVDKEFGCPDLAPSCFFYIPGSDKQICSTAWSTQDANSLDIMSAVPPTGDMFWNVSSLNIRVHNATKVLN